MLLTPSCFPSLVPFSFCGFIHPVVSPGPLSGRELLLIKELIFSFLSLICIVNLKHCEFFKCISCYQKEKKGKWGIFNRLSSLPGELCFFFLSSQQCKEILLKPPSSVIQFLKHEKKNQTWWNSTISSEPICKISRWKSNSYYVFISTSAYLLNEEETDQTSRESLQEPITENGSQLSA